MDVRDPTFPSESIVLVVHDDADVHEAEHVAYFRSSFVESRYEMCNASLESMAIELYLPTSPEDDSMVTSDQEVEEEHEEEQVAYFRSSFVESRYEICNASLEAMAIELYLPTSPEDDSMVIFEQEEEVSGEEDVAYFRLVLVAS